MKQRVVIGPGKFHHFKLDSKIAFRRMKTYSESRIELQNLPIPGIKKMVKKPSQLLSLSQPCEPKSLDIALKIAGVEKIRLENLRLRSTLEAIRFEF